MNLQNEQLVSYSAQLVTSQSSRNNLKELVFQLTFLLATLTPALFATAANQEKYHYNQSIQIETENFGQAVKVFEWLDLIQLTEKGKETLIKITQSGHRLTILHHRSARYSAGITSADLSEALINGIGSNVDIKLNLDIPNQGSHCVLSKSGDYIEYPALHNLFHELAHAGHKMKGTWLYFDSEGQAIREENQFRIQWAAYRHQSYQLRSEFNDDEEVTIFDSQECRIANN